MLQEPFVLYYFMLVVCTAFRHGCALRFGQTAEVCDAYLVRRWTYDYLPSHRASPPLDPNYTAL